MMLSFKQFIAEEISSSDAKGKLHEILVAKYLSPDQKLPTHYRDPETQKSPEDTHDHIVRNHLAVPDSMGNYGVNHEDYVAADKRAREAAEHIRKHLGHKYDFSRIKGVAWTSNKKDHKQFTGDDDPNSDADVMIHTHKHEDEHDHTGHFIGVSLKVGSQKPNLRNPGIEQLNRLTKANTGHISGLISSHGENLHALGYDKNNSRDINHEKFKLDKEGKNGNEAKANSEKAKKSSLSTRSAMAKHYADSINNLHPTHVEHLMKSLISPDTLHEHIRVHTKVSKAGKVSHHAENPAEDFAKKYTGHEHGYVAKASGISFHIHAKNPDGTPGKKLASVTMKQSSGPVKGIAGSVKAHH
jgi:hypothetical protein